MSLGKHLSGYTVDDEGRSLMDLLKIYNEPCKSCEDHVYVSCDQCRPYRKEILDLIEKILINRGIRKIPLGKPYEHVIGEDIVYYCERDYYRVITIILADQDGYNCAYGTQNTIYLSSTLKSNGLEELGDYVDSICSNPN